jgi:hypothetical protein
MLSAIYIALLILTVLVLLVLFAAFDIFVNVEKKGNNLHHIVRVKWLFFTQVVQNSKSPSEPDMDENDLAGISELKSAFESVSDIVFNSDSKQDSDPKEKSSKFKWDIREIIAAIKLIIKPVLKLLDGLLSSIHIKSFKGALRFGFDNPANTGVLCGYIYALKGYLLYKCKNTELDVEPVFIDEVLDFFAVANFRIRLASLIPVLLLFVINKGVLKVSWAYFRNKSISV